MGSKMQTNVSQLRHRAFRDTKERTHRLLIASALQPIPNNEGAKCFSPQPFRNTEGSSSPTSTATSSATSDMVDRSDVPLSKLELEGSELPRSAPAAASSETEITSGKGIEEHANGICSARQERKRIQESAIIPCEITRFC
jgi:hypothetical protein